MTARRLDGKAAAAAVLERARAGAEEVRRRRQRPPALAVVLCGDNSASLTYVRNKQRVADELGINARILRPAPESDTAALVSVVQRLNHDPEIDAVLVQLPLPPQVVSSAVIEAVDSSKDADGFHPCNLGRLAAGSAPAVVPCTPAGCMELLRHAAVPVAGKHAVVVGRSTIVGRPLALLLLQADATVTVCHSKTEDLAAVCRQGDILVAATGTPGLIGADFVKPGACVIDVGTTFVDGRLRGDVDYAAVEPHAAWISPVPGGVGPMTIAMLMHNTVALARARCDLAP